MFEGSPLILNITIMIKTISTLLILFSTIFSHSQNITLVKNTNPKAKELKHNLNTAKDSLILSCENKIFKVEIFNEDYENIIIVDAHNIQISLKEIPVGKFVIETKLLDKIIVTDLIVYDNFEDRLTSGLSSKVEEVAEGKGMMLDEEQNIIKSSPKKSLAFILTRENNNKENSSNQKFFWTETHINNKSGSSKTKKLVDQKSAERMILKHKHELNSETGKLNELTVWEVYNTRKFMQKLVSNPDFVYTSTTDLFNKTPYYVAVNSVQNP